MGIRFACHVCGKHLNIKRELAGRRGVCPACASKFRIPLEDAETSSPVESKTPAASPSGQPHGAETEQVGSGEGVGGNQGASPPDGLPATYAGQPVGSAEQAVTEQAVTQQAVTEQAVTQQVVSEHVASPQGGFDAAEMAPVVSDLGSTKVSLLDDDPEATWYVRPPSGGQYGPASGDILKQWIGEGRVAAAALLWRDGWPQWRSASEALYELADQLPSGQLVSSASASASGMSVSQSPAFSGQAGVGTERRNRAMRRVLLIGVLSAVALSLIGILLVVANMQVLEPPANP